MNRGPTELNLRYALRALRRRLPLFLAAVLIVPAIAVGVSFLQKKEYTASASLLFSQPQFDQMVFGSSITPNQVDPTRQAATNLQLVSLPKIAALTAPRLHLTEQQVSSAVSESSAGQSDLISIQATARTPEFAAKLANTFAAQYIDFRRGANRATINAAELPLKQQIKALPKSIRNGSLGQSLRERLSQLKVLASLQTGNAELVQPAEVPKAPSSPKPIRNGALGLFFGLLLGIALVVLAEVFDRRVRDASEVEQIFERPLLATLPQSGALTELEGGLTSLPEAEREALRMLWANLRYFTLSRDIRSVLITSADRDDGKTTVAWGLAVAAASAGKQVLVVEADLRNPTLASRLGAAAPHGLISVLAGDVALGDAITRYGFPRNDDDPRSERWVDALLAGPPPPDPADLLQSQRMVDFMRKLEAGQYDLIVIDTPPAVTVSDAIPLIPLVQGVIVVSRLGNTVRDHARRLRQQLEHLNAALLGVVVNSGRADEPYEYSYGTTDRGAPLPAIYSSAGGGPQNGTTSATAAPAAAAVSNGDHRPLEREAEPPPATVAGPTTPSSADLARDQPLTTEFRPGLLQRGVRRRKN
jgi:capsular exopolysaccharide synthesis family protein